MEKQIIATQDVLVKCDNPECDYKVENISKDINNPKLDEYLNVPCPKCGENLLTEQDLRNSKRMAKLVSAFNKIGNFLGLATKEPKDGICVTVGTHKGKFSVDIEEDEKNK